ncbi:MAG TPA: prepilin-type N-terminal cleavage/methylation domain-containing protein [Candidatus Omnitrophota bacterium]|nr:prepilin-type N-terminal cleavage/methylation domain-containing protein [Candidatus Omnitrophota bacterium]HQQ05402.1 prepilin-type N-terminal cleavage/methylation domain-containing protein [Candidatus Omnitrophota bacterium]
MAAVRKGVTLIELVVAIVITGILAGLGGMIVRQVVDSWNTVSSRSEAAAQMNIALGRMARQIRSVRDPVSVLHASSDTFRFTRNGDVNITYNVSGNALLENGFVLSESVERLSFTYYNATGAVIASPAVYPQETNISRIAVELEIRARAGNKVRSITVRPRNLGG